MGNSQADDTWGGMSCCRILFNTTILIFISMVSVGIQLLAPYYFDGQTSLLNDVAVVEQANNNPWATASMTALDLGSYRILSGGD